MDSDTNSVPSDTEDMISTPTAAAPNAGGANMCARELSKRRVTPKSLQTPTTPATPIVPSTPIIASYLYGGDNVMEDLQLAAELGKTLLERNRDLETNIKHQQAVIEDQSQEIEYLSKQTCALKEVNDSRLRIYEQLEISIQELEKGNQRLNAESLSDKKKIKNFTSTIEQLETKVVELQKSLEEAKNKKVERSIKEEELPQERSRSKKRRSFILLEELLLARRSQSCENTTQTSTHQPSGEEIELREKVEQLETEIQQVHYQHNKDLKKKEELEIEVSCLTQEVNMLMHQLDILREKDQEKSLEEELNSIDETTSSKVCRKCLGLVDETESNNTMQDFTDDLEDFESSFDNIQGGCALIKLTNGGYAYGSQESLASLGQIMKGEAPCREVPIIKPREVGPRNSILSELDTQYRILIEKYESLIETRQKQQQENQQRLEDAHGAGTIVNLGVDEISGPMSIVLTNKDHEVVERGSLIGSLKCQRCTTCTCDLKPANQRPKSNSEFSEVETTSSGFSEGESRLLSRGTQTCQDSDLVNMEDISTPTTQLGKCFGLPAPFENRFQSTPEYKVLFHEIFTVLKKTVNENELDGVKEIMDSLNNSLNDEDFLESLNTQRKDSKETKVEEKAKENDENLDPNECGKMQEMSEKSSEKKKKDKSPKKLIHENHREKGQEGNPQDDETKAEMQLEEKPRRPDTLEIESLSRSSSRQSRRRRRNKKTKETSELPLEQPVKPLDKNLLSSLTSDSERTCSTPRPSSAPTRSTGSAALKKSYPADGTTTKVSNQGRCEHKQVKHKSKKNRQLSKPLQEKALKESKRNSTKSQYYDSSYLVWNRNSYQNSGPISHPLVEVAKLRQLEMTYAQALKSTFDRTDRRF